jgi:hypothetical protein
MNEFDAKYGRQATGARMACDGIVYTLENEQLLISLMFDYMIQSGYTKKQANNILNCDEDFIPDNFQMLPRG